MTRRVRLTILLSLLAVVALRAGQNPQTPANQTPTFRSGVEYRGSQRDCHRCERRVRPRLEEGRLSVLEDGSRQTISDFTLIDIPVERYDKPLSSPTPIEPDTRANEQPFDGRVYVMVIDDRHTDFSRTPRTKAAARLFIQQRLGANDIMAVVHTAGAEEASQEFTNNKRLLLAAVEKTVGRALPSSTFNRINQARSSFNTFVDNPQDLERAMNAESSLRLLKEIADWFQTVRGRRKAILFISEGIDYDITQVLAGYDNNSPSQPARFAGTVIDATREAIDAAMRSNVSIFGIDPRGLVVPDVDASIQSFPDNPAAGVSAANLRNELDCRRTAFAPFPTRLVALPSPPRTTSWVRSTALSATTAILRAGLLPAERQARWQVPQDRRPRESAGPTVRARRGYLAPRGRPPAQPAPNEKGPSLALRDALNSPLPVSGLTMQVALAPFKGTAANASVFLTTEFRGRDLSLVPNGVLEYSYVAVDPRGRVRGGNNDQVRWNLKPETKTLIEQSGFRGPQSHQFAARPLSDADRLPRSERGKGRVRSLRPRGA